MCVQYHPMSVTLTRYNSGEDFSHRHRKCCPSESQHWENYLATIKSAISIRSSVHTQPFIIITESHHDLPPQPSQTKGQDQNRMASGCGERAAIRNVHRMLLQLRTEMNHSSRLVQGISAPREVCDWEICAMAGLWGQEASGGDGWAMN